MKFITKQYELKYCSLNNKKAEKLIKLKAKLEEIKMQYTGVANELTQTFDGVGGNYLNCFASSKWL